jgi:hypothetical protein
MQALGYTQYGNNHFQPLKVPRRLTSPTVAQGGDIGYSVIRTMALFYRTYPRLIIDAISDLW